jgi:hypothetical protein
MSLCEGIEELIGHTTEPSSEKAKPAAPPPKAEKSVRKVEIPMGAQPVRITQTTYLDHTFID